MNFKRLHKEIILIIHSSLDNIFQIILLKKGAHISKMLKRTRVTNQWQIILLIAPLISLKFQNKNI